MIPPLSTSSSVSSTYTQSTFAKLPSSLQYGMSSFSQLSAPKKSMIILSILGLGTLVAMLWKRIFSKTSAAIPREIQEWVKQNCKDLDAKHQAQTCALILITKANTKQTATSSVQALFDNLIFPMVPFKNSDRLCKEQCNKVTTHVYQYVRETHPTALTFLLSFIPATDAEISDWCPKKWPDLSVEDLTPIINKVHDIESHPAFQINPKKYILELRLNRSQHDNILLKAIVYLSFRHKVNGK